MKTRNLFDRADAAGRRSRSPAAAARRTRRAAPRPRRPASGDKATLSLVAYSTPQVVYDEIIPDFQKTAAGKGVGFKTSFGASGDQAARSRPARRPTS